MTFFILIFTTAFFWNVLIILKVFFWERESRLVHRNSVNGLLTLLGLWISRDKRAFCLWLSRNFPDFGWAAKNFSGSQRRMLKIYAPFPPLLLCLSRQALAINFKLSLFSAFRMRLSNGATNHHRNDPDAKRSGIIATWVSFLPSPSSFVFGMKSSHQLSIFDWNIIYTRSISKETIQIVISNSLANLK